MRGANHAAPGIGTFARTVNDFDARIVPPDDLRDYLKTYVALTDVQYDAVTLWTVHSHTFEAAETTPYLQITSDGPRAGKGHPHGTQILTPNGWLKVEDLNAGDYVIGSDGHPTRVLETYYRGVLPVYHVEMSDGSSVRVDGDHLWLAATKSQRKAGRTVDCVETRRIADTIQLRWAIPMVEPVQFPERDLPVDPYVLGVLIGDGHLRKGVEFTTDEATAAEVERRLPQGFDLSRKPRASGRGEQYTIRSGQQGRLPGGDYARNGITLAMEALGLVGAHAGDKFVPEMYLYASEQQRRDLLAGLMDTDGELSIRGERRVTGFSSASALLRDQVAFLIQSLGGIARKDVKEVTRYSYRGETRYGQPSYRLRINMPTNPFLTRQGWKPHAKFKPTRIVDAVTLDGEARVTCIRVAAADSLYVTEDCIVTHNSRLLEVLELVVDNPWLTGRVTGPALVRKIDAERPTLLLDETDATFSGAKSSYEILRGVLNTGYRLNGRTSYAVGGTYKDMTTYCPKALAGIGSLPSTIADRAIPIRMERRDFEQVQRFRRREALEEARFVRARLARYAAQHLEQLADARPLIPSQLDDRAADVWEPLLAIADTFSPTWGTRARVAAVSLMQNRDASPVSALSLELLADVRRVFDALGAERVSSEDLQRALREVSDTWAGLLTGDASGRVMCDLLRGWRIERTKIRFGRMSLWGFYRAQFEEAWKMVDPDEPRLETGAPGVPAAEPVLEGPSLLDGAAVGSAQA